MKKHKILYGICGIGNGHTYRQLPIVEHFAQTCEVMIFAHDNSYEFYSNRLKDNPSVKVVEVAIPFYVGDKNGIDFKGSAEFSMNKKDIFKINCAALAQANQELGKPDLVITDYESVSAQYAYAHNVPLITIDQQSKYLCGDFPKELGGFTFEDEIMRLHMFFPRVDARIACSFFNVSIKNNTDNVLLFPPIIKDSVKDLPRNPKENNFLVYISSAREYGQAPEAIAEALAAQKNSQFHVFVGKSENDVLKNIPNVGLYQHGDPHFTEIMRECSGIVATAGHSLLSEAMYLGIPVYAIPVSPYEQHMNARVIDVNSFGIAHSSFDSKKLAEFIENIPRFKNAIQADTEALIRGIGQEKIIRFLEEKFLS